MPAGLHRTYGAHHLHFITNSCYHRLPFFDAPGAPDCFLAILEQTRQRYRFVVVGYVVMPEHIHLLITEPEIGTPSTVMQVLKQRTARALLPKRKRRDPRLRRLFGDEPKRAFWQARFYDFNVWSTKKRVEKLRYMHNNPVKRGLVESPELWAWSSYRYYHLDETGPVQIDAGWAEISFRDRTALEQNLFGSAASCPPLQKSQGRGTSVLVVQTIKIDAEKAGRPPARSYAFGEEGIVKINQWPNAVMKGRGAA